MKKIIVTIISVFLLSAISAFSQNGSDFSVKKKSTFKKNNFGHNEDKGTKGLPPDPGGGGGGNPIPIPYGYFFLIAGLSSYVFIKLRKDISQKI